MSRPMTLPESLIRVTIIMIGILVIVAGAIVAALDSLKIVSVESVFIALILLVGAVIICIGTRTLLPRFR